MVTIYNLKNIELLQKHFETVRVIANASLHKSVFKHLNSQILLDRFSDLIKNNGLILKATYGHAAAGLLIAEIRNHNEFGVLEFCIDPDAESRIIDLLFKQCQQQLKRRGFKKIYCNHDWFESVNNSLIRDKFLKQS